MEISFVRVLISVFSLIILMVPGYLLVKTKILPKGADEVISPLVLYGGQTALMFMGFQKAEYKPEILTNMLIVAGLAAFIHLFLFFILWLCLRKSNNDAKIRAFKFASVFSNCGYMGLPFLQTLYGGTELLGEILIYASVVIGIFNIFTWTIGVIIMSGDKSKASFKKIALNPTLIALAVGLIVFFVFKKPLTDVAADGSTLDLFLTKFSGSMAFLADMVTPLAMIVLGIRFANMKLTRLFVDKTAYISSAIKLVGVSFVTMLTVAFLPIDVTVKYVLFFTLSMPSATNTVLFAIKFGGDGDSASIFVTLSTILSVVTIPLMYLAFSGLFGIVV